MHDQSSMLVEACLRLVPRLEPRVDGMEKLETSSPDANSETWRAVRYGGVVICRLDWESCCRYNEGLFLLGRKGK